MKNIEIVFTDDTTKVFRGEEMDDYGIRIGGTLLTIWLKNGQVIWYPLNNLYSVRLFDAE